MPIGTVVVSGALLLSAGFLSSIKRFGFGNVTFCSLSVESKRFDVYLGFELSRVARPAGWTIPKSRVPFADDCCFFGTLNSLSPR